MNIEKIILSVFFTLNDAAIATLLITAITAANLNIYVGIFTGLAGLFIQFYFKLKQDKREQERSEREKNH